VERKLLQIVFALAGLVLVGFGLGGVFLGANFMDLSGNVVMNSYIRFLKGMLLAIGLIYWSSVPDIERHGVPTIGILISLAGELIVAPLLCLWQRHVARVALRSVLT
jgi:hypothetical protein